MAGQGVFKHVALYLMSGVVAAALVHAWQLDLLYHLVGKEFLGLTHADAR